jgi:hypothetical protein
MFKRTDQNFLKRRTQMAKNMKKCSTSLAKKEMHIKTMLRFYLTPVKMVTIKNTNNNKCCEDVEKKEPSYTLVGM